MTNDPQTREKQREKLLEEFLFDLINAQLSTIMEKLQHIKPSLFEDFVDLLLKNKKSPLFKKIHFPGLPVYGKLLCWKRRRIGLKQIQPILYAWSDQSPCAIFLITTSGCTDELRDFAKASKIPFYLLDLEELIATLYPGLQPPLSERRKTFTSNIHFLP